MLLGRIFGAAFFFFFDVLLAWERHDFRSLMIVNGDFESLILDFVGGSFWSLVLYTTLSMNATSNPMNNRRNRSCPNLQSTLLV